MQEKLWPWGVEGALAANIGGSGHVTTTLAAQLLIPGAAVKISLPQTK